MYKPLFKCFTQMSQLKSFPLTPYGVSEQSYFTDGNCTQRSSGLARIMHQASHWAGQWTDFRVRRMPSSIQYCLSLIKHGFSLRSLLSTFLLRSHFLWALLKTAALKQPGNACEPFRRVKCPKSRVIHGLVSKQQSRGGRASAGSRARAITAGRRAAPRWGGLWSGGLGSVPELVAAESTCVPDGADPGQALGVSEASCTHRGGSGGKGLRACTGGSSDHKETKDPGGARCPHTR